jgi:hypothetical protein
MLVTRISGCTARTFFLIFFFFFFLVVVCAHSKCPFSVNSIVLLVVAAAVVSVNAVAELTGDAAKDFTDTRFDAVSGRPKNFGVVRVQDGTDSPDVGVPGQFPRGTISGWDIRAIFFQYDDLKDELLIGVDCFGVCGDADGDGDAGGASPTLRSLGGQDLPDLARGEGFAIVLDFDLNVADVLPSFQPTVLAPFDFVIGVPAGQPADAVEVAMPGQVEVLPCSKGRLDNDLLNMANCFGVYEYQNTVAVNIARRFLREAIIDGAKWPTRNGNPNPVPARPDLEWTIGRIIDLRARKGAAFNRSNREPWNVLMQAFSGSFLDAGVGEDYLPSQTDFVEVSFPCLELDQCDVCLGDNNTCLDCAGTPNGSCVYDQCDVCCGDNRSCRDCAGTPNGSRVYDVCDVCGGNGSTCRDCRGTSNGSATYDVCDICNGNGSTCLDCRGVPNGPTRYDVCDVCGGDSSTCRDCAGTPNGSRVYDRCDVCGGNSSTCLDCLGLPNGRAVYDVCDVCNGDGSSCSDCIGVPNGSALYDICDVCNGDGSTCDDCAGVSNGSCTYDACDVCCGDGTTCLDCADTPFGTCKYDNCGVCCGDGSSCVCLKIHECPTVEVDHALLEWSLVATIDRIEHTVDVLEGIKSELCRYDVNRGNLASDIAGYLGIANEFRDILDNFVYVSIWFKETLEEAIETVL